MRRYLLTNQSIMKRMNLLTLLIITFIHCSLCIPLGNSSTTQDFDYFMFTQQWPIGECIKGIQTKHECFVPSDVNSWTIHGLWPSSFNKHDNPENCDPKNIFNYDKIKTLKQKLMQFWPNMYSDTKVTSFWEHEWSKHGTCALSVPDTNSEYNYFKKTLELGQQFDLYDMFSQKGILPSNQTKYHLKDFMMAINDLMHVNVNIECVKDTTGDSLTDNYVLFAVELCLNKKFLPINCPEKSTVLKFHPYSPAGFTTGSCPDILMYPKLPKRKYN